MAFKFNPFSGTFDATGASDAAPFAGQVDAYTDLPLGSTAALNSRWLVKNNSGIWPFSSYKQAGIYIRVNTLGASRDTDYQFVGTLPSVMNDSEFLIYDDVDATKNLKFNVGANVPTASTVTLTAPAASGTIARTADFAAPPAIGNTTSNTVAATTISATGAITGAVAGTTSATSGCNGFQIPVPAAGGSSAVGMYGTFSNGSQRAVIFGASTSGTTSTIADFSANGLIANSIQNTPIGSTTPNSGAFTTVTATGTTELVNGTSAAGPLFMYRSFTNASNYERAFMRWESGILRIGTERLGGSGSIDFELTRMGSAWVRLINSGLNIDTALRVNLSSPIFISGGYVAFQSQVGGDSAQIHRDAADTLAQRNAANAQEFRLYGTFTSSTNYQRLAIKTKSVTLSALSGASVATTTGFIPDGAVLVGLTTRVSTAITGATGYDIGDGSDADRWGANIGVALNTSSDNTNWTAGTIECFTAAQEVTLTAVGSNFTGGAVVIVAHYLAGEAD